MNILIAGGSWACGEWLRLDIRGNDPALAGLNGVSHKGLEQYLIDNGHNVYNISTPGASNTFIKSAIINHLKSLSLKNNKNPDKIIVFQSSYIRDYQFRFDEDWTNVTEANTLAHVWLARFYSALSEISKLYDVPIYLIGGCSDIMWLDQFEDIYPGLHIACQSMVNLIVNKDHRVRDPVLAWYINDELSFVEELKKTLSADKLEDLFNLFDVGIERQNLLDLHPEYFFPDGVHPNRVGHKILYDFLKDKQIV